MKLKVKRRTMVILNTIAFLLISVLFVIVISALKEGRSAFSMNSYEHIMGGYFSYFVGYSLFTALFIFFLKRAGAYLFLLQGVLVTSYSLMAFYATFNKVILFQSFAYATMAFYFYLFIRMELSEAYYKPGRNDQVLKSYDHDRLKIHLKSSKGEGTYYLTNWGESGFYCRGDVKNMRGRVEVSIAVDNVNFKARGVVVSQTRGGLGIKVLTSKANDLCWSHFYDIIKELGLKPLSINA